MFVVTVLFVTRPEAAAPFRRAVIDNARASREHEPGCRQFDVAVDPTAPDTFYLYELYDDRAAFDAHLATAHFREFDAASRAWIADKTVRCFERVDPLDTSSTRAAP